MIGHMVPPSTNNAATGGNSRRDIALPLLGSNQDSPDPEKGGSATDHLSSGLLRPIVANWNEPRVGHAPVAPQQDAHSHEWSHDLTTDAAQPHRFGGFAQ